MWWHELQAMATEMRGVAGQPSEIDDNAIVADTAIFDTSCGPIKIGARTEICEGAFIQGPVEIGSDCLIGNLGMIRGPSRIGNGTRIGFAAEIKGSIIEEGVTIGPQCFVADSKIEHRAYLGAQVRTSNHRLDQQTVRVFHNGEHLDTGLEKLGCHIGTRAALGIQVIVLPGRIIAPETIYAPRITVERNLPTGRYRQSQQLEAF